MGCSVISSSGRISGDVEFMWENRRTLGPITRTGGWNSLPVVTSPRTYSFKYLSLPLSLRIFLGSQKAVFLQLGGYGSYHLFYSADRSPYEIVFAKTDVGAFAGIGFRKQLGGKGDFGGRLRYMYSVVPADDYYSLVQANFGIILSYGFAL
jgi:hypothetical protein